MPVACVLGKRALLTESELFSSALHKPFTRSSQMPYTQFTGSYEPVRLTLGTFVVFRPNVPCGAADVTNVSRDITRPTLLELGSQYKRFDGHHTSYSARTGFTV